MLNTITGIIVAISIIILLINAITIPICIMHKIGEYFKSDEQREREHKIEITNRAKLEKSERDLSVYNTQAKIPFVKFKRNYETTEDVFKISRCIWRGNIDFLLGVTETIINIFITIIVIVSAITILAITIKIIAIIVRMF